MPDEVKAQGLPPTPPPWWPSTWPWPPTEPWYANVKRTYDWSESEGLEKEWSHRGLVEKLYDRQAKREDMNQRIAEALWNAYIARSNELHTVTMQALSQIFADDRADARVARHVTYNVPMQKSLDATLLESLADKFREASAQIADIAATLGSLKEFMGPPRGGAAPVTPEKKS